MKKSNGKAKETLFDPCKESLDALRKFHADTKAGHKDAAPYWLGKSEAFGTMCSEKHLSHGNHAHKK